MCFSAPKTVKKGKNQEKPDKPDPGSPFSWPKMVWALCYGVWKKIQSPRLLLGDSRWCCSTP